MVNSRHLLMGASLSPKISHLGGGRSALSLFFLADEVWAIAETRARKSRLSLAFMLGAGGLLWLNWVAWTGLGAAGGMVVSDPATYGFDFAFTAIFIGLLASLWQGSRTGLVIAVSALTATAVHLAIEGPWYIAAGGLAGAAVGFARLGERADAAGDVNDA